MSIIKKEKLRTIPKKNYIYLSLIIIATLLILLYSYLWYNKYNESKLSIGIMNNYLSVINYNELDDYIIENKNAIIYVSVLGNEEINKFEKKFKNTIIDNNLKNSILYLNITNENIYSITNELKIDNNLPYIVVYTNGEITDTYSIAKNKYDSKKALKYLNRIGVTDFD